MQGLIGGFVGGDPSALTARRAGDPFASLIASLGTKVWVNARDGGSHLSLSGSLVNAAQDLSGSGNSPSATGALRPSYDAAAFGGRGGMLFSGAQALATPSFSMGARQSGAVVWRPTADNQSALEFGAFETHGYVFCSGGAIRVRRSPAGGEVGRPVSYPIESRLIWRSSPTGIRVIFNGFVDTAGAAAGKPTALTAPLYLGALASGTTFFLSGHIGELIFADAEWGDAEMNAVNAAIAARWS